MINKIIGFLVMLFSGAIGAMFLLKKQAKLNVEAENNEIKAKDIEVKNEVKQMSDINLDNAINDELNKQS